MTEKGMEEVVDLSYREDDRVNKFITRDIKVRLVSSTVGNAQLQEDAMKQIKKLMGD